jgi:hypothetical protein
MKEPPKFLERSGPASKSLIQGASCLLDRYDRGEVKERPIDPGHRDRVDHLHSRIVAGLASMDDRPFDPPPGEDRDLDGRRSSGVKVKSSSATVAGERSGAAAQDSRHQPLTP